MRKSWSAKTTVSIGVFFILSSLAYALDINPDPSVTNNRFSSGYPSAPIANTNSNFIGLGYDWSGVGWNASNPNQSFALLGSRFFLYANHLPPAVGGTLQFTEGNGLVKNYTVQGISGSLAPGSGSMANGDLAVGRLSSPIPTSDNIHSYSILFLGYNTSYYLNPEYRDLDIYGFSAKIGINYLSSTFYGPGELTIDQSGTKAAGYYYSYSFDSSTPGLAKLQIGDSGSPTFIVTSTPGEMFLSGDHYAVFGNPSNPTGAVDSFLAMQLPQISGYMAQYGYLPSIVTPSTATWNDGTGSTSWGVAANWSSSSVPADILTGGKVTSCASVLFDGALTTNRTINLDVNRTVTGIAFSSATGLNPFTIATGSTSLLTIGEAGINNKDDDIQTLSCNIALRTSQRWSVGQGGLSVSGSIDTGNGNLLLIDGPGNTSLAGVISNSGSLSKDGAGTLTLSSLSANTYTGKTFINGGTLAIGRDNLLGAVSSYVADQLRISGGMLKATDTFTINSNRGIALDSLGGTFQVDSGKILTANSIISTLNGATASPFSKTGPGTLVLNAANTYNGLTTVVNGTLKLANSTALGTTAAGTVVQSGGVLDLNGLTIGNESLSMIGVGIGNAALISSNSATTAVLNGSVSLSGNSIIGGQGNISLNGSLNYGSSTLNKNDSNLLTITGAQTWGDNSKAFVNSGTLVYQQAPSASTSVSSNTSSINIQSGATVNVDATYNDPFTDDANTSRHLSIINNSLSGFNLIAGTSSVGTISGTGVTTISGSGTSLYAKSIKQSKLVIGQTTSSLNTPLSGSISVLDPQTNTLVLYAKQPTVTQSFGSGNIYLVPEPATWILLLTASIIGMAKLVWRRASSF